MQASPKKKIYIGQTDLMEVTKFQQQVTDFALKWDKKRKVFPSEQMVFIHLVEEVGELATQYVNQESRKEQFDPTQIEDGLVDILTQVLKLASMRSINIEKSTLKIIKEEEEQYLKNL